MKRVLLLAVLAALFVTGAAGAQGFYQGQLHYGSATTLQFRTLGSGSNADTAWATGSAARTDTTVGYPLSSVFFPVTVPLASDSLICMMVRIEPIPTSGITIQGDSAVFLLPQVSMDNSTWITMTPPGLTEGATYHVTGANKLGFNSGVPGTAGTNAFFFPLYQWYLASGFPSYATTMATAPRCNQWIGWKWVRFLMGTANTWKAQLSVEPLTNRP